MCLPYFVSKGVVAVRVRVNTLYTVTLTEEEVGNLLLFFSQINYNIVEDLVGSKAEEDVNYVLTKLYLNLYEASSERREIAA